MQLLLLLPAACPVGASERRSASGASEWERCGGGWRVDLAAEASRAAATESSESSEWVSVSPPRQLVCSSRETSPTPSPTPTRVAEWPSAAAAEGERSASQALSVCCGANASACLSVRPSVPSLCPLNVCTAGTGASLPSPQREQKNPSGVDSLVDCSGRRGEQQRVVGAEPERRGAKPKAKTKQTQEWIESTQRHMSQLNIVITRRLRKCDSCISFNRETTKRQSFVLFPFPLALLRPVFTGSCCESRLGSRDFSFTS